MSTPTPTTTLVDAHLMDYFLIELVSTLRASSAVASARQKRVESEMKEAGLAPCSGEKKKDRERDREGSARDSVVSLGKHKDPLDEADEPIRQRLESIGMHVGANFAERLSTSRPPFTDTLDAIKFICKDVWTACWNKQIDNLRTNHRGIYVLLDTSHTPLTRLSSFISRTDAVKKAKMYAYLPAGIIRGVLVRVGVGVGVSGSGSGSGSGSLSVPGGAGVSVTPEISSMPQCTFQVKLHKGS